MFSSNTSQVAATATAAEAVDFSNDYLSRSDLVGNTNGKTFTFSAWIWFDGTNTDYVYYADGNASSYFQVSIVSNGTLVVEGTSTTGSVVLSGSYNFSTLNNFIQTFYHVLISVDLTDTAKRSIYVNDLAVSVSWVNYTNTNIAFMQPTHTVAGATASANYRGRLSNVFLDYTYRDMSITANRRLFVTADLKPAAGQAALNPILYLPMSNPTTVGTNAGTGGNFTLTGTIARSGRGPNQYNAPYSDLDGSADYLSRTTAPTGIADSSTFTIAFSFTPDATTAGQRMVVFASSTSARFDVVFSTTGLSVSARNTSTLILSTDTTGVTFVVGRNYSVVVSVDLTDTAKRHIYINGQAVSATWSTYTSGSINFNISTTPRYYIGTGASTTNWYNGKLGALWFNTSYIDLSVPANLAKFVSGTGINAAPVDLGASGELPTGTSPLIYLPMYGNNAGKNYGTGGDFTVNSGPYTGARGPNEFWGNKASGFNGSSDIYLTKATALSGVPTSGSTLSIVCWFNLTNYTSNRTIFGTNSAGTMTLQVTSGGNLFMWLDSSGYVQFSQVVPTGSWVCLMFSKTGSTYTVYVNDTVHTVDVANSFNRGNSVTYTNTPVNIATRYSGSTTGEKWYGSLSEFYFTTEYIDFSQEANRLKFRDCFGNPTDLPSAITAASVPNPAIYMRFPPTSFGTNSGTGGNFTVTGTITDGGQL